MGGLRVTNNLNREYITDEQVDQIGEEFDLSRARAVFCREFVITCSIKESAKRAGITRDGGTKILKDPRALDAIRKMHSLLKAYDNIGTAALAGQMAIWSKSNINDYYDDDWIVKKKSELTIEQLSCINSIIRVVDTKTGQVTIKLTLIDKLKANENLARPFGLYEQIGAELKELDNMTEKQLIEFIEKNKPSNNGSSRHK